MKKKTRLPTAEPMPPEEKYGRIWGGIFIGIVLLLAVVLFGKACFFSEG